MPFVSFAMDERKPVDFAQGRPFDVAQGKPKTMSVLPAAIATYWRPPAW